MRILGYFLAAILGFGGIVMLVSWSSNGAGKHGVAGLILWAAAATIVILVRMRPATQTHIHKMELDLSGDVKLEHITCKQCGAELRSESVHVAAGAVFVHCEYCGSQYQLEEEPKW